MIKKIVKFVYKKSPISLNTKTRIKFYAYRKFGFLLGWLEPYRLWRASCNYSVLSNRKSGVAFPNGVPKTNLSGTIAIQLHLYYIDLLDSFVEYLSNMPYKYDLLVSVSDKNNIEIVKNATHRFKNLGSLIVKVVPNRGRDVAPFTVAFAEELVNYEYFCHIHSKKSLFHGSEQVAWRNYLLNNLIGSHDVIYKIFWLFGKNKNLGLVYPETDFKIPYWGHTWLSNRHLAAGFLSKFGMGVGPERYIDFSTGTMFWARTTAILPLLTAKLKYDDFQKEEGQIDGTTAHVVERCLVQIVKNQNYDFAVVDFAKSAYSVNFGHKNMWQYWHKSRQQMFDSLKPFNVISFDIFDTLITRLLFNPDMIFKLIAAEVLEKFNISEYVQKRRMAEELARSKALNSDCNIDAIYREFSNLAACISEISDAIKKMEIDYEYKFTYPRFDMIELVKLLKDAGKKIILVSDMYLTTDIVKELLQRNNFNSYDELYVSGDFGKRKDRGDMWEFLSNKYKDKKYIHVGDNEQSDVQMSGNYRLPHYHVMSGASLLEFTPLYHNLINVMQLHETGNDMFMGLITARNLNSPFALNKNNGQFVIENLKDFGFTFIAPVILYFMQWLIKASEEDGVDNLLFLSREGLILNKVFNLLKDHECTNLSSQYFLTSRRAASIASLEDSSDIDLILKRYYLGSIHNLLENRFDLDIKDLKFKDQDIQLPEDFERVKELISPYYEEIIRKAKIEKQAYLKYFAQSKIDLNGNNAIVDIGYAGSIQYYLSKIITNNLNGYYFALNDEFIGNKYTNNKMSACFESGVKFKDAKHPILKYHLILESVLTASDGQLIKFVADDLGDVHPKFRNNDIEDYVPIQAIHDGILEFFTQALKIHGAKIIKFNYSEDLITKLFELCVIHPNILDKNIKNKFLVEDGYCSNDVLSVFDLYKQIGYA